MMPPETPTSKRVTPKRTRADDFGALGAAVHEQARILDAPGCDLTLVITELVVMHLGGKAPDELIAALGDLNKSNAMKMFCHNVRGYVEMDRTEPVPAKYVGRTLRELGAVTASRCKDRVEMFAFFHTPAASGVLTNPSHRKAAQGCFEAGVARARGKPLPSAVTKHSSDEASKKLHKPIQRLEDLRLAEATTSTAATRRTGSYLINHAELVFDGWPEWPKPILASRPASTRPGPT